MAVWHLASKKQRRKHGVSGSPRQRAHQRNRQSRRQDARNRDVIFGGGKKKKKTAKKRMASIKKSWKSNQTGGMNK